MVLVYAYDPGKNGFPGRLRVRDIMLIRTSLVSADAVVEIHAPVPKSIRASSPSSDFHAPHKLWRLLLQPHHIPPHALVLRGGSKVINHVLPDPLSRQTLLQLAHTLVPIGLTLAA